MHVDLRLDVDVIGVGTADEVSVLVELSARAAGPRTLQIVIDRSASMRGRLEQAVRAVNALVDRLDPADNFGVVAFDNAAEVIVPTAPCRDKAAVKAALNLLGAGGNSNLSAGYLRGIDEARRVAGNAGATLLLITDGRPNEGVRDAAELAGVAAEAYRHGVVSSTLGWGTDYDERLLSAIARAGSGNEGFAADADAAIALITGEVEGLLSQTVPAASLRIRVPADIEAVTVVNDLPVTATNDGILVELGSLYSGETRRVVLTVVRTELVYQRVQRAKRSASRHLSAREPDAALAELDAAAELVWSSLDDGMPETLAADLTLEAEELRYTAAQTRAGDHERSAKYLSMSSTYKSRKRGRDLNRTGQAWHAEPDDAGER